jgi:hypothetical protein
MIYILEDEVMGKQVKDRLREGRMQKTQGGRQERKEEK